MTEKQIKMVRAVLNEHINVNLELLERKDLSASDKKGCELYARNQNK